MIFNFFLFFLFYSCSFSEAKQKLDIFPTLLANCWRLLSLDPPAHLVCKVF